MKISRSFLPILLAIIVPVSAAAQVSDPAGAVRSFYSFDGKSSQVFNRRNLEARRRYLSPRLYNLFRQELRRQADHLRSHPDEKPFFGDGFPFRPLDEPCMANGRSYYRRSIVQPVRRHRGNQIDVTVRFSYPRPCTIAPVIYRARVTRKGAAWLVDDIIYEDGSNLSDAIKNHRY